MNAPTLTEHATPLDAALYLAAHLGPVFPLRPGLKEPFASDDYAVHTEPRGGFYVATTDPATITGWFTRWPTANIGLRLVNVAVVDIDVHDHDGYASLAEFREHHPFALDTIEARTASSGTHFFVKAEPGLRRKIGVLPGVDYLVNGYVIVAPSRTHKGAYSWVPGRAPWEREVATLPDVLREAIEQAHEGRAYAYKTRNPAGSSAPRSYEVTDVDAYVRTVLDKAAARISSIAAGERRDVLNREGFALGQFVGGGYLGRDAAAALMAGAFKSAGHALDYKAQATIDIALDDGQAQPITLTIKGAKRHTARPGARDGDEARTSDGDQGAAGDDRHGHDDGHDDGRGAADDSGGGWALTDLGNARRLVVRHGRDLRFCYAWDKWLIWDGQRWRVDDTGEIVRRAKQTVRAILAEAAAATDDAKAKDLAKHALRSQSAARIMEMIKLAESEPEIPVTTEALDVDPWLLNVTNGTIELRTGVLRPPDRADLITKVAPVAYDSGATCPTFDAFLSSILNGSAPLIRFVQRAIGYALTGSTREQAMAICYGSGSNGKTTLLDLVLDLMGEYGMQTSSETMMAKHGDAIPNDIARLRGARFVTAVETEQGRRLNESLVKQLTGGDRVSARFMRSEWFDFKPTFKLWMGTNHKPVIKGTERAIWRRIRLIPFAVTIPDDEQDKDLPEKLRAELPGVLQWALRGCLDWQREGLAPPEAVTEATNGYRAEMDVLATWVADCCVTTPSVRAEAKLLYRSYSEWCEQNGERAESQRGFGQRLGERGYTPGKSGDKRYWRGIGVLAEDQPGGTDGTDGAHGTQRGADFPINNSCINSHEAIAINMSQYVPSVPNTESNTDALASETAHREIGTI